MMKKIQNCNVLITSAGRRVELVEIWKNSLKRLIGNSHKVYTCDLSPDLSPACFFAHDKFKICSCMDFNYPKLLLEKCLERNIKVIIPTIDPELIPLSKAKELFGSYGIKIVISDIDFIENCINKQKTEIIFRSLNVDFPKTIDRNNILFPCFMKPNIGNSSKGVRVLMNKKELNNEDLLKDNYLFQELIDSSWKEFTLDLYYDKNSFLKACIPRERIEVRGGEISKGYITRNELYYQILSDFKFLKGAKGVITLQIFSDVKKHKYKAIEINPRFGGGYPMSHMVGANYPDMIIKEYFLDEEIFFNENWEVDHLFLRYEKTLISKKVINDKS